ncbi:MAG: hypothetical protein V1833_01855 [Elusimicrobiota bacterium]
MTVVVKNDEIKKLNRSVIASDSEAISLLAFLQIESIFMNMNLQLKRIRALPDGCQAGVQILLSEKGGNSNGERN